MKQRKHPRQDKIRARMALSCISIKMVAERLGMSYGVLQAYLLGDRRLTDEKKSRIKIAISSIEQEISERYR